MQTVCKCVCCVDDQRFGRFLAEHCLSLSDSRDGRFHLKYENSFWQQYNHKFYSKTYVALLLCEKNAGLFFVSLKFKFTPIQKCISLIQCCVMKHSRTMWSYHLCQNFWNSLNYWSVKYLWEHFTWNYNARSFWRTELRHGTHFTLQYASWQTKLLAEQQDRVR